MQECRNGAGTRGFCRSIPASPSCSAALPLLFVNTAGALGILTDASPEGGASAWRASGKQDAIARDAARSNLDTAGRAHF